MSDDDLKRLSFALEKYPESVVALPVERLVMDSARQNPKRAAYLKLAVPDEVVKTLRGDREMRGMVLLVTVPKEIAERGESPIVLPNEVG